MIQITPHMRILVAVEPIDFRAGIDRLVGACRQRLEADPFSGALFVFCNRARTARYCASSKNPLRGFPSSGRSRSGSRCSLRFL